MVRIIQNYTLYQIIGEGAYGKVYRAINQKDNKEYAVKVIEVRRFKENKKLEECTVNEINILTNIEKNEHIIKYIDMLKTPNNFYFVYEFCNGGTLESILRKERVLPEKQALLIFKQIIDAFQVLNKYNIMHRDLKPDNIFFSSGVVKLGDFGFCKSLQKTNMTKTMLGSPIYMAPQILRGEVYSTKADIWSLGVVLFQTLYGFCPFESTTIPKLIEVLKETELQFPNKEQVSQQTKKLLKRLLTKDPTKRIEWMQLLQINITNEGTLIGNRQECLSLEGGLSSPELKLTDSYKYSESGNNKKYQDNSMQNNSASTAQEERGRIEPNNGGQSVSSQGFMKKKNGQTNSTSNTSQFATTIKRTTSTGNKHESPVRIESSNHNLKDICLRQHGEAIRGLYIAVDLIKSNDINGVLFAFLILKKAEQKLIPIRDELGNVPALQELVISLNSELKEIGSELSKYNINENPQNWKALVKSTGQFHRNYRAFFMMVMFLSGETGREDMSQVEMQTEVRNRLY